MRDYSFLQSHGESLVKESDSLSESGLWNGKMGYAITLFHLAQVTQNKLYENTSFKLIDSISENLFFEMPFSFGNGLLGIGAGFEYIINKGFVEGDSDEILSETDMIAYAVIGQRPTVNLNLEEGVCGIGYYLFYRLKNKENTNDSLTTLMGKEHLIYLIDWIEELLPINENHQEICDTYFLLSRLHTLDVINFKIEKLIDVCLDKMKKNKFYRFTDNYSCLGIDSLKLLTPWM